LKKNKKENAACYVSQAAVLYNSWGALLARLHGFDFLYAAYDAQLL
jgi:hypothetical protein